MPETGERHNFLWGELETCTYCRHYITVGTHAAQEYCFNKESPYFDAKKARDDGMYLTPEQALMGCERLEFSGQKIPAALHRKLPTDSCLRQIEPSILVQNYSPEIDLTPVEIRTSEQLGQRFRSTVDSVREILKEGPVDMSVLSEKLAAREKSVK